jgi:magnesium chelatase subunit D
MYFPFTAIVGQEQLKTALLLCAVDPGIGGVLIRGDKGSAKSTAARALTAILPPIDRVAGCAFNCLPGQPCQHCERCSAPPDAAPALSAPAPVPFVTLPLGATEDRVLGTLDLQQALKGAQQAFQPGLLASAHRGILYIDEVNLLADHLVDVLLDVAAMGVNAIEREGLSVRHPARFTLIGTMNLEEGDLRPQLLDRFGLMVDVTAPRDKAVRAEVVRRRFAFEADPDAFARSWEAQQHALRERVGRAQQLLPAVALDDALLELVSHICCEFDVASLRADIVLHKAGRALAALDGRNAVTPGDIRTAAALVLPHRRRRSPFEQAGLDHERLDELMRENPPQNVSQPPQQARQEMQQNGTGADTAPDDAGLSDLDGSTEAEPQAPTRQQVTQQTEGDGPGHDHPQQVFRAAPAAAVPRITVEQLARSMDAPAGRRSDVINAAQGRTVRAAADGKPGSLAIAPTLRSAALRDPVNFSVLPADVHRQVRAGKTANLILLVVDSSGSMAASRRMEAVKGAVLALLTDAYQRRDEVALIAFGGATAQVLLEPTRSVERAELSLRDMPTGGRTPLPHALQLALQTLEQAGASVPPLLVLLSDGRANVALGASNGDAGPAQILEADPWRESLALAGRLAVRGVAALVLDTESGSLRLGRAAELARALGAPCIALEELSAHTLALTIRGRLL